MRKGRRRRHPAYQRQARRIAGIDQPRGPACSEPSTMVSACSRRLRARSARRRAASHIGSCEVGLPRPTRCVGWRLPRWQSCRRWPELFPGHERSAARIGQRVQPAFDPGEPTVYVAQQDFRCLGHAGRQLARPLGGLQERLGASQRLLPISGHDRLRVLPPIAGSPLRRRCSWTILERRLPSRLGRHGTGSTSGSTLPEAVTLNSPKPSSRHSLCTRRSRSRPRPR